VKGRKGVSEKRVKRMVNEEREIGWSECERESEEVTEGSK